MVVILILILVILVILVILILILIPVYTPGEHANLPAFRPQCVCSSREGHRCWGGGDE